MVFKFDNLNKVMIKYSGTMCFDVFETDRMWPHGPGFKTQQGT